MNGLVTVPRAVDLELGRDKRQTSPVYDLDTEISAQEYNTLKNAVATIAERFGIEGSANREALEYWYQNYDRGFRMDANGTLQRFRDEFAYLTNAWTVAGATRTIVSPHAMSIAYAGAGAVELDDAMRFLPASFTLTMRIKVASSVTGYFGFRDTPATSSIRCYFGAASGQWYTVATDVGVDTQSQYGYAFTWDEWHTIKMVGNSSTGILTTTVDGEQVSVTNDYPAEKFDYKFEINSSVAGNITVDYFDLEFAR